MVVFISSAQQEFEEFRHQLKETIDTEEWSDVPGMRAILIEDQRGSVIPAAIRRALDEASIYVGIFGKQLRPWPVAEFAYAKARGLPMLVYKFERRSRPGRPRRHRRGRVSEVDRFLNDKAVDEGIRVNGPYRNLGDLPDIILQDLALLVVEMVRENADIRRRLYTGVPGAP